MPLVQSATAAALAENIRRLMAEGYSRKQATAIALDIQRKAKARARMDANPLARKTAERVAAVRLGQTRARKRIRRLPRQRPPKAIEREYARALIAYADRVRAAMQPLLDALPSLLDSAAAERAPERMDVGEPGRVRALMAEIREHLRHLEDPRDTVGRIAGEVSGYNREQLARQANAAFGVDLWASEKGVAALIDGFKHTNAAYWEKVSLEFARDIEQRTLRAVADGKLWRDFAKDLESAFDGNKKRARLVARDQVGKLYGQINAQRQQNLGIRSFIWRTVGDDAVRTEHEQRDGVTYSYDDPPDGELPGEPINCRCYADPVFDEILDEL